MGINKVEYNGNTLIDLTDDTVTPGTLAEGVTAHNAAGEQITGTMKAGGGGEAVKEIEIITCDFDLATLSCTNLSHTCQQIIDAINANKYCIICSNLVDDAIFTPILLYAAEYSQVVFSILLYTDGQLYYFYCIVMADNSVRVHPKIISMIG